MPESLEKTYQMFNIKVPNLLGYYSIYLRWQGRAERSIRLEKAFIKTHLLSTSSTDDCSGEKSGHFTDSSPHLHRGDKYNSVTYTAFPQFWKPFRFCLVYNGERLYISHKVPTRLDIALHMFVRSSPSRCHHNYIWWVLGPIFWTFHDFQHLPLGLPALWRVPQIVEGLEHTPLSFYRSSWPDFSFVIYRYLAKCS